MDNNRILLIFMCILELLLVVGSFIAGMYDKEALSGGMFSGAVAVGFFMFLAFVDL